MTKTRVLIEWLDDEIEPHQVQVLDRTFDSDEEAARELVSVADYFFKGQAKEGE